MTSIKISDIRKVIFINKALNNGYSLPVAAFQQNISIKDYQRVCKLIRTMGAK